MRIIDITKEIFRTKIEMSGINFYFPKLAYTLFNNKIRFNPKVYEQLISNIYNDNITIEKKFYSDANFFLERHDRKRNIAPKDVSDILEYEANLNDYYTVSSSIIRFDTSKSYFFIRLRCKSHWLRCLPFNTRDLIEVHMYTL